MLKGLIFFSLFVNSLGRKNLTKLYAIMKKGVPQLLDQRNTCSRRSWGYKLLECETQKGLNV